MSDFPMLYKVKQEFDRETVTDLDAEVKKAVKDAVQHADLPDGAKVAVTAGSRGIQNIVVILQTVIQELKDQGYAPFLVAAMGSHGGGKAEGQKELLESLGITETSMGVPISCSTEAVQIGETDENSGELPVYMAPGVMEADATLLVNRIKPHTSFRGPYESGLLKMAAVGLGRPAGATMVHKLGADRMAEVIPAIAKVSLEKSNIIGGVALVENAYDETAVIQGAPKDRIFEMEKELQARAKKMMPSLPVAEADLCLVGEMGKNYSGTGMDTNIIGRMRIEGVAEPETPAIRYLGVLRLSEESHGNANGIGLADFTTEALVSELDREPTYLNCVTSGFVIRAAIPLTFSNDRELLEGAIKTLKLDDPDTMRLVYIKNTLHVDEVWVSEPVYEEIKEHSHVTLVSGPAPIPFDEDGQIQLETR
ncbi:MAG TPA: DUF2088 domain-containing protein [Bacillales bacterium]|nr:DUF2088 domain-containing protein [Bacillales bacterium]